MRLQRPGWWGVGAWGLAAVIHGQVQRPPTSLEVPPAPVLAGITAGRHTTAGTLAWCATVVHAANAPEPSAEAVWAGVSTATTLDGGARAPVAHGALLLRRLGRPDLAERALDAGMARFPHEPWFPWARGMVAWIDRDDPDAARPWLQRAEALSTPGAP